MITDYFARQIASDVFKSSVDSTIIPDVFYIGFSTTMPVKDGSGVTEPTASDYQRIPVYNQSSFTKPDEDGYITNEYSIYSAEAKNPWNGIVAIVIFDAEEDGNLLIANEFTETINLGVKEIFEIPPGGIKLRVNN